VIVGFVMAEQMGMTSSSAHMLAVDEEQRVVKSGVTLEDGV